MKQQEVEKTKQVCSNCGLVIENGVPIIVIHTALSLMSQKGYKLEPCLYCKK